MPVYYDKQRQAWRFSFNRIIGGRRIRATKLLPKAWGRTEAEAYDRAQGSRLYAESTGIAKPYLSLAGAVALYLDHRVSELRGKKNIAKELAHLEPYLKGKSLESVPDVARAYLEAERENLAPATIRNRLAYLKAAVRYAFRRHGYGEMNHADRILLPTVKNERDVYLKLGEVRKLLQAIGDVEARAVFTLAYWCGLRWIKEVLSRKPADVRDGWLYVGETKNGTPRMVPVHPEAVWALKKLPFKRHWRTYYAEFELARARVDMAHVRAHDLRHSLASAIISSGGTLADVQAALHHEDVASAKRYAHLYPERLKRVLFGLGRCKRAHVPRETKKRKRA